MDDHASAALVGLVRGAARRRGLSIPAAGERREGPRAPLGEKRALVDALAREGGLALVHAIGADVRDAPFDPVLHMLERAPTGRDLVSRWLRLERYVHSRHRLAVVEESERAVVLRHVSLAAEAPAAAEDLLVAGLLVGLLERIGCAAPTLALLQPDGSALDPRGLGPDAPAPARTELWRLAWAADPPARRGPEDADPAPLGDPERRLGALSRRLLARLEEDPARAWRLEEAARALGRSPRTLQRRLAEDGLTVSEAVASARIREACRLLAQTDAPIGLVGLLAGFCDHPHFARAFKRRVGLAAGDYRAAAGGRGGVTPRPPRGRPARARA